MRWFFISVLIVRYRNDDYSIHVLIVYHSSQTGSILAYEAEKEKCIKTITSEESTTMGIGGAIAEKADEIENSSRLYVTTVSAACLWKVGAPHLGAATRKVQWQ